MNLQLVDDIPLDKMTLHDVAVDIICTPTRVIRITDSPIPKPTGATHPTTNIIPKQYHT
jgi:hypothetical protein